MSKIVYPLSDIIVAGQHAPRGEPVETTDAEADALIVQGFATATPPAPATAETALADPAEETAKATPTKPAKKVR